MPAETCPITIRVQAEDFDLASEQRALTAGRHDIGAVTAFSGLCRGEGHTLTALELEHYPGMAEKQLQNVADDASARWCLDGIVIIHRFGKIAPGENIVLVLAASRHRDASFEAARFIMDFLKTDAPFWKKEHRQDGSTGSWVDAKESDEAVKARWQS